MATKFLRRFSSQAKILKVEAVKQVEKKDPVKGCKEVEAAKAEGSKEKEACKAEGSNGTVATIGRDCKEEKKCEKPNQDTMLFDNKSCRRVNVSLQGANTRAGFAAALLLKQHPLIKKIYMYDARLNTRVAGDLNSIDSNARVEAFCGDDLTYSLRAADITVLIDTDVKDPQADKKFESSYFRVKKIAEICNLHCPKAMIVVNVDPICSMTSLVQCVLEETPFYHPSRLVGNINGLQSIINTITARKLHLDPTSVHVPLIGGSDIETVVPLISLMTPDPALSPRDQIYFYEMLKKEVGRVVHDLACIKSTIHDGYAIGKMCLTIAKGLNGHTDALGSVLSRSTQAYPLKYLVTTVRFGQGGIYHNYGIPKLTSFELQELEKTILILEKQEKHMEETQRHIHEQFLKCSSQC